MHTRLGCQKIADRNNGGLGAYSSRQYLVDNSGIMDEGTREKE